MSQALTMQRNDNKYAEMVVLKYNIFAGFEIELYFCQFTSL